MGLLGGEAVAGFATDSDASASCTGSQRGALAAPYGANVAIDALTQSRPGLDLEIAAADTLLQAP